MTRPLAAAARKAAEAIRSTSVYGRVAALDGGAIRIEGLEGFATLGDFVEIGGSLTGEIIAVDGQYTVALPMRDLAGVSVGARADLRANVGARPCAAWLGKVLNAFGRSFDGSTIEEGSVERPLTASATAPSTRRGIGERVNTGLAAFDTFLPLCRGQRVGLFAGSGVGKSTLLASLARGVEADVVVCALIGERSREVREFVEETLGPKGRARSVVIASTSEDPAPIKRRAALLAMTVAEHFRDQGKHVLLLFDSVTRFADAWREIGLTAGETPSLRAYPPSTFRTISALAERSGPGSGNAGDITAIFTVLVAGSDMDEPVADMMRGILDGHIVLERSIAERGRFPAIDVRRSVSRALPKAAAAEENAALAEARSLIAAYEESAIMIQSGLYAKGADPVIDRAIEIFPKLDAFIGSASASCASAFAELGVILKRN